MSHGDNGTKNIRILSIFTEVTYYALNINRPTLFDREGSIMNTEFINESVDLKARHYILSYKSVEFSTVLNATYCMLFAGKVSLLNFTSHCGINYCLQQLVQHILRA